MKRGIRIRLNCFKKAIKKIKQYDFIHFGSETCENLITEYEKYIEKIISFNKKTIISIPPLSQKMLEYFVGFIYRFKKHFIELSVDFSVNDFGTVYEITKKFPEFKIVIGRHFSKYFFSTQKDKITFNSLYSLKLIKKYGISSFEISTFPQLPDSNIYLLFKKRIIPSFFIHYPYILLSTSRNCTLGFRDILPSDNLKGIECDRSCIYGDYIINLPELKRKLYLRENSLYRKIDSEILTNSELNQILNVKGIIYDPF